MGRPLRWIPEGGSLVEVTTRTLQSRLLLKPGPAINDTIVGVLARAKRRYPLQVCADRLFHGAYTLALDGDSRRRPAAAARGSAAARKPGAQSPQEPRS